MAQTIQASNLASEITKLLSTYNEAVTDEAKKVVDEISQGVMQEITNHITFNSGKKAPLYAKSFRLKTSFEDKRNKRNTWYVTNGKYRLTHLLEFGHYTRNGTTRTRAFPHVKYGQEYLDENFEKRLKEEIEKCKI